MNRNRKSIVAKKSVSVKRGGDKPLPDNFYIPVFTSFAKTVSPIAHQHDPYNQFMVDDIHKVIASFNPYEIIYNNEVYQFNMTNVRVEKPKSESINHYGQPMTPQECRAMKSNYMSNVYCDVRFVMYRITPSGARQSIVERNIENELLVQVPIMLRSQSCWTHNMSQSALRKIGEDQFELGGYFIIEGNEKAIVSQDEKATNYVYLNYRKQKKFYDASIKSRSRSMLYSDISSHLNIILEETSHQFYITLNLWSSKKNKIPVNLMFQALGAVTDLEIVTYMIGDVNNTELFNIISTSMSNDVNTEIINRDVAARILIHKMLVSGDPNAKNYSEEEHARRMKEKIDTQFLPHLGTDDMKKRFFLGYMCRKVLNLAAGKIEQDDIFNYGNKRIHTAGILVGMHVSQILNQLRKNMQNAIVTHRKQQNDMIIDDVPAETVHKFFHHPQNVKKIANTMATGKWNIGSSHYTPSNKISMIMERKSRIDPISMLRRISTGTRENNTNLEVHLLNTSLWGFICCAETPESDKIGLMKNLALTAHITVNNDSETVKLKDELDKLFKSGLCQRLFDLPITEIYSHTNIFVNGGIDYCTDYPLEVCRHLRAKRQDGILTFTSVIFDYRKNEIRLYTDHGRIMRPLYIVGPNNELRMTNDVMEKLKSGKMDWNDLLREKIIEYVCIHELQHNGLIAVWPSWVRAARDNTEYFVQYTHCEIHPSAMFGISALLIPFPNFEHSPRITFQSVMVKQSMDLYATNLFLRYDTVVNWLVSPQKPLTTTFASQLINMDLMPNGINAIIVFGCFTGFNQDDSLMFNESSGDRGMFNSFHYKTYAEELQANRQYINTKPDPTKTLNYKTKSSYDHINQDGMPIVGRLIHFNDVILGRVQVLQDSQNSELKYKDKSVLYKDQVPGIITKVTVAPNSGGEKIVRIVIQMYMKPDIGDKLSARHGQKGTCGLIVRQDKMPYLPGGITPDVIVNPHAIPSRMTIGMMKEMLYNMLAVATGNYFECSSFGDYSNAWIAEQLKLAGYDEYCNVPMYHPVTGEKTEVNMFAAPAYYQRLKHLVGAKIQARASGPKTISMRQPVQGKKEGGGSRIGEMERDALLAHGVSEIIREKFLIESDKFHIYVCDNCGLPAIGNKKTNTFRCDRCPERTAIYKVRIPYASKRFFQETTSYGISTRFLLE